MLIFGNRKVQQVHKSYLVYLPTEWIKSNGIKKSDPVRIELLDDGNLKICLDRQRNSVSTITLIGD
jgi:hypothetical protein